MGYTRESRLLLFWNGKEESKLDLPPTLPTKEHLLATKGEPNLVAWLFSFMGIFSEERFCLLWVFIFLRLSFILLTQFSSSIGVIAREEGEQSSVSSELKERSVEWSIECVFVLVNASIGIWFISLIIADTTILFVPFWGDETQPKNYEIIKHVERNNA